MNVAEAVKALPTEWAGSRDEVAQILGVHPNSVTRYVRRSLLRWDACRGPAKGQERVSRKELSRFVREYFLTRGDA